MTGLFSPLGVAVLMIAVPAALGTMHQDHQKPRARLAAVEIKIVKVRVINKVQDRVPQVPPAPMTARMP